MSRPPIIFWFKRDLRVADNPALALAAAQGPVLPLFIVEPALWREADRSARQWTFLAESLSDLRDALAALGQPLIVRLGEAVAVLETLRRAHGVVQIVSQQETGALWTFARDRAVAAWAAGQGVAWNELPQGGVVRGLRDEAGWSARRRRFLAGPPAEPPALEAVSGVEPGPIPTARILRLPEDPCPHRQRGGRQEALMLLHSHTARLHGGTETLAGERRGLRLSAHLGCGAVSVREVLAHLAGSGIDMASLRRLDSRLLQRDRALQLLERHPALERQALAAHAVTAPSADRGLLEAFERGETGLPFVDACLRYLAASGWISAPLRGMLVSVGCHLLGLDWRSAGLVLARRLTDYEAAVHWMQVQHAAGVGQEGRARIVDPLARGRAVDPTGAFIRRWVPELGLVPTAHLHAPWTWSEAQRVLGRRYPEPVVDPARAARDARRSLPAASGAPRSTRIRRRSAGTPDNQLRFDF
ncbi:FAD-binding domain-containing protein [Plastorhodobacter daqingensis]|uniref:FAD-binding domain-containing protein n=1 Tax=Plastorhodobacter daqingensis TaxID=1387281 RepID=A0ABW2UHA8_9RHOB